MSKSKQVVLHIAFDDTDSRTGRCTTHLGFKIVKYLKDSGTVFLDYPLLIRLNPNIPWKTRGNGAVCLRVSVKDSDKVIEYVRHQVESNSAVGSGANPGIAFLEGRDVPLSIKHFSRIAMFDILSRQKAQKIAQESNVKYFTFGNGQGLVGSLAAIGCLLDGDHTFEAIAYRKQENCGKPRIVDESKVVQYSNETYPKTFNNYDFDHRRVLITPHGPDPVFCGIRGEDPETVVSCLSKIGPEEKLDGYMVYRSNQGTNMHLQNELRFDAIKAYTSGFLKCTVVSDPYTMQGGHVLFTVQNSGQIMLAAVYEPTGLVKVAMQLAREDIIEIGCGVRKATSKHPKALNIEYLSVFGLAPVYDIQNPGCKKCGKRMKSEGKGKGFQCDRCKYKDSAATKNMVPRARTLKEGLYIPTPKAHRHLTKPWQRYGLEKSGFNCLQQKMHRDWFYSIM